MEPLTTIAAFVSAAGSAVAISAGIVLIGFGLLGLASALALASPEKKK